jgi:hypothetical protein
MEMVSMIRKVLFLMAMPLSAAVSQQSGNNAAPQQPPITVKAAKPEYRAQAKISAEVATNTASAKVPGGRVQEGELEKEHGRLVYSFDILVPNRGGVQEVQVDARSGKVVSVKHESPASEAQEHAAEQEDAKGQEDDEGHEDADSHGGVRERPHP